MGAGGGDWEIPAAARTDMRRRRTAAVLGIALAVALAATGLQAFWPPGAPDHDAQLHVQTGSGTEAAPRAAVGEWTPLPPSPLEPRSAALAVWTGNEVLVWGGLLGADARRPAADGAAFDPDTGHWRRLAAAPTAWRRGSVGVWTGRELVVLGPGDEATAEPLVLVYEPGSDRWRRGVAPPQLRPRPAPQQQPRPESAGRQGRDWAWRAAAWTGAYVLVLEFQAHARWEGRRGAVAYDPGADTWTRVASPPIEPRAWSRSAQLSDGRIAVSGVHPVGAPRPALALWDPVARRWGGIVPVDGPAHWAPSLGIEPETGDLVAAGSDAEKPGFGLRALAHGGDGWRRFPLPPGVAPPRGGLDLHTGAVLLAWDGERSSGGALYDVRSGTWSPVLAAPGRRRQRAEAWIGEGLFSWGGLDPDGQPSANGDLWHLPDPLR